MFLSPRGIPDPWDSPVPLLLLQYIHSFMHMHMRAHVRACVFTCAHTPFHHHSPMSSW